jgi:hypothetical protein
MNLKTIKFKRAFLETLTANEMKATRGGYGYGSFLPGFFFVPIIGVCIVGGDVIVGNICFTSIECDKWFGSGARCSNSF